MRFRRGMPLVLFTALLALVVASPAHAARGAKASERKALATATANWSKSDSIAIDGNRRLYEKRYYGSKYKFESQGMWVSTQNRSWARVIVRSVQGDRISTVLRRKGGRWRAVASGGFAGPDADNRDGAQCKRSRISKLVARDLALGKYETFDPKRRCQGRESLWLRQMTSAEVAAVAPMATSDEWPALRDDRGGCTQTWPGDPQSAPLRGYVSRNNAAWSVLYVYCKHNINSLHHSVFAAVFRDGQPFERLAVSKMWADQRCWDGRGLKKMPSRARLDLDVCAQPLGLLQAL